MAGNARFHDKLHRKNHHTNPTVGYADSASDPIASPSEPFQGDFVVNGQLSASKGIDLLSANIAGDIYCNNIHVSSVTYTNWISGNSTETIISDGALTGKGNNTLTLNYQKGIYGISPFFSISNTLCSLGTITSPVATFDTLTVKTSTNLNGPLSVFGNTNLNGTLTVTGSSTINGKLSVGSDVNINGNLLVNGNLSALGDTTQIDTNIVSTSALVIDTYGTTDALRITQRGTGNVLLVEDETNPDSSPFVVTNSGYVGIGTTSPITNLHIKGEKTEPVVGGISQLLLSNSSLSAPWMRFGVSMRNGDYNPITQLGDQSIFFSGNGVANSLSSNFTIAPWTTAVYAGMRMTYDGKIGIGTATPTGTLHVNASSTSPAVKITQAGSTGYALYVEDESGDNTPTVIDYQGHMGIGTTTPNKELTVNGSISSSGDLFSKDIWLSRGDSNREGGQINFNRSYDDAHVFAIDTYTDSIGSLSSRLRFLDLLTGTERMTMLSSGYLGIGNAFPNKELTVTGSISASGHLYLQDVNNYSVIHLGSDNNAGFHITKEGSTSSTPNSFNIWTGQWSVTPVSRMSILTSGNVGIGVVNPTAKLHLSGSTNNSTIMNLENDSTAQETSIDFICNSTGGRRYRIGTGGSAGGFQNGTFGIFDVTSNSLRMIVTSAGNVAIGTASPTGTLHVSCSTTSPAVKITQLGSTGHALYIEDESGDNTPTVIDYAGHMGIGTTTPNKELTVVGDISATGTLYTHSSSYSLSSNGYTKLPNGLIMQWGSSTSISTGETTVNFPIPFPNQCYSITSTPIDGNGSNPYFPSTGNRNLSSFNYSVYNTSATRVIQVIYWQAIGY
jgi:cytoskeletal protein CcmA (bactofilin family)